jgi:hypothetical protein
MKQGRFNENRMMAILKEQDGGMPHSGMPVAVARGIIQAIIA